MKSPHDPPRRDERPHETRPGARRHSSADERHARPRGAGNGAAHGTRSGKDAAKPCSDAPQGGGTEGNSFPTARSHKHSRGCGGRGTGAGNTVCGFFRKPHTQLPHDPTAPLLGTPLSPENAPQQTLGTHAQSSTAPTATRWQRPQCPPAAAQTREMCTCSQGDTSWPRMVTASETCETPPVGGPGRMVTRTRGIPTRPIRRHGRQAGGRRTWGPEAAAVPLAGEGSAVAQHRERTKHRPPRLF